MNERGFILYTREEGRGGREGGRGS